MHRAASSPRQPIGLSKAIGCDISMGSASRWAMNSIIDRSVNSQPLRKKCSSEWPASITAPARARQARAASRTKTKSRGRSFCADAGSFPNRAVRVRGTSRSWFRSRGPKTSPNRAIPTRCPVGGSSLTRRSDCGPGHDDRDKRVMHGGGTQHRCRSAIGFDQMENRRHLVNSHCGVKSKGILHDAMNDVKLSGVDLANELSRTTAIAYQPHDLRAATQQFARDRAAEKPGAACHHHTTAIPRRRGGIHARLHAQDRKRLLCGRDDGQSEFDCAPVSPGHFQSTAANAKRGGTPTMLRTRSYDRVASLMSPSSG